jgi:hypothetical protein
MIAGVKPRRALWMLSLSAISAVAWWYMNSSPDGAIELQTRPVAPAASGNNRADAWLSDIRPAPGMGTSSGAAAKSRESLSAQVARLAASADPKDAFRAYWLLYECVYFERHRAPPGWSFDGLNLEPLHARNPREVCNQLTERMKGNRIDYVERAAAAGVAGAMSYLVEEGPFADRSALTSRPDDPLVKEWKDRINTMLRDRAAEGQKESLMILYDGMLFDKPEIDGNDQRMLTYGLALGEIFRLEGVAPGMPLPFDANMLALVKARLTQPQIDKAESDAAGILRKLSERAQSPATGHKLSQPG